MAPLKAYFSGVFNPVKNCCNAVKLCITEWSQIFVGWLFLEFIPVMLIVLAFTKGLMFDVALPILDIGTDVKFAYDMYEASKVTLDHYMVHDDYEKDTCFDYIGRICQILQ